MKIWSSIANFIKKTAFNTHWTCVHCRREIFDGGMICKSCESELPVIREHCLHCGRKLVSYSDFCEECKGKTVTFDKAVSVYEYDGLARILIKRFKYDGRKYIGEFLGKNLADKYLCEGLDADIITYVPMSKKERRKRGFNQSKILARETCKELNVPCYELLEKVKETKRQATLGYDERVKNLKNVFKVRTENKLEGITVCVIDDVMTTGATAENVSNALKKKGVAKVYFLTVASVTHK